MQPPRPRRRPSQWLGLGSFGPLLRPALLVFFALARPVSSHWHERWYEGTTFGYSWFDQDWVRTVRQFYCDESCEARLVGAATIDREFKALVDLFNQTTGGPRDVYRGAFQGLDEFTAPAAGSLTRRAASLNQWKHMHGWESILTAHTSTLALCTELKLDGNVNFTRSFCYENINASSSGPRFPDPRWSVIEDCCLKYNRTIGHGNDAYFWTDRYESPPTCVIGDIDVLGYPLEGCRMVGGMGIVVGRYGRILRTSDGGTTWQNVASPTSAHLNGISMNEENTHSGSVGYEPQARARPSVSSRRAPAPVRAAHVRPCGASDERCCCSMCCRRRTPHGLWATRASSSRRRIAGRRGRT